MGQLISVRSNQYFGVNYETGKLIPQTEVIILVEKPKYLSKGSKIHRSSEISEIRFKAGTEELNHLIGQLQSAQRVAAQFEQMAGAFNEIIINTKPLEGSTENL